MEFGSQRELFDYALTIDTGKIAPLQDVLKNYKFELVDYDKIEQRIFDDNCLIIDARSPREYFETHIPNAVNFPVLNNEERHYVGIIYKKYSDKAALKMAMDYADPKAGMLAGFLESKDAKSKKIIVHCWRGGGRSKYLAKLIIDSGFNNIEILRGGIKSYRNKVVNYFSLNNFPYNLLEISGLTGTGKTEIIRELAKSSPVVDLEKSARHFSSLFGFVPYKIRQFEPVKNQTAFENNIYAELLHNRYFYPDSRLYFVESESKKVGNFFIPQTLYYKIEEAKTIKIESSFENRVNRIVKDYFEDDNRGLGPMEEIFTKKDRFFRKELSNEKYFAALGELHTGNAHGFTEIMLKYYDWKYKEKPKTPLAVISSDNLHECVEEVKRIYVSAAG